MAPSSALAASQQRRIECLLLILQWRGATLKDGEIEKVDLGAQDEVQFALSMYLIPLRGDVKSQELLTVLSYKWACLITIMKYDESFYVLLIIIIVSTHQVLLFLPVSAVVIGEF